MDIEAAREILREADTADSFGTLDDAGWEDLGRRLAKALQLDDSNVREKMPWALWGYAIGVREDRAPE
ncbi:hypothetical protein [Streptomyces sp. 135]|uniref:hypothetical protein n=1 Tax=Streptomyces sp. 135 TaxID=2838850 RepID=UPI001CBC2A16|nr:hypothetical protein [Streptomyces sp. 135]